MGTGEIIRTNVQLLKTTVPHRPGDTRGGQAENDETVMGTGKFGHKDTWDRMGRDRCGHLGCVRTNGRGDAEDRLEKMRIHPR